MITADTTETGTGKLRKISDTKSWFFEKIWKIGKTLARLIREKREKMQMTNIESGRQDITPDSVHTRRTIKYYKQFYTNTANN